MTTQNTQDNDIARQILVDIAKQKGYYDERFTSFLVTPEELAPYIARNEYGVRPERSKEPELYLATNVQNVLQSLVRDVAKLQEDVGLLKLNQKP